MRALVTGAGAPGGIGLATARLLGAEGHTVAICSTSQRIYDRAAELREAGISATGHICDLTDPVQVAALRRATGPVDILVNNAGMGTFDAPGTTRHFLEMSLDEWHRAMSLSLDTAVLATRVFLPDMVAAGWGRIVMMASVTGPLVSNAGESAYSAAKAAMVGLTHALALEMGGMGVTVNAVAPGWVATEAATESERIAAAATPMGRAGTAEEIGAVAAFLASPAASYVNGAVIVVDGGNVLQEKKGTGAPPAERARL
jgi:3-oxoacyl-[acyl-carrier protein] reductase